MVPTYAHGTEWWICLSNLFHSSGASSSVAGLQKEEQIEKQIDTKEKRKFEKFGKFENGKNYEKFEEEPREEGG